jgi:hypothetical protein
MSSIEYFFDLMLKIMLSLLLMLIQLILFSSSHYYNFVYIPYSTFIVFSLHQYISENLSLFSMISTHFIIYISLFCPHNNLLSSIIYLQL